MGYVYVKIFLGTPVHLGASVMQEHGDCGNKGLQSVKHLFLYLFQFVLHLHDNVLHLSLIRLGTGGVYLTPHLLSDEPELLAPRLRLVHCVAEVLEMVGKTLLLL